MSIVPLLLLVSCGDPGSEPSGTTPTEPPDPTATGSTLEATCAANELVPAVLDCGWTSAAPGAGLVEYWPEADPAALRATPAGPDGTAHDRAVLGLKAGRTYEYRVVVQAGDSRIEGPVERHTVPNVPLGFPALTVTENDPKRSQLAGGYLLVAIVMQVQAPYTILAIVDTDGDYVWWVQSDEQRLAIAPRFSRDGKSVWYLATDMQWQADVGLIHRVALDGSVRTETRALLGHHAVWENADGTLTWLGFDYQTFDGVPWASDVLRTAAEGIDDAVVPTEEFSWFDAYGVAPWSPDPGGSSVSLGDATEWTHSNSLMATDDASFYLMSRHLDCLIKVDRATGAVDWQLGGLYGDFTHPGGAPVWATLEDNDLFSHAHMSHLWDGGMVVFDNGVYHQPPRSGAVEYRWDEAQRTVEEVWRYDEPDGGFTASMGDVRKLPGGNYVVAWAGLAYVSEVTPDGEIAWELRLPQEVVTLGRITPLDDLYAAPDPSVPL